MSEAEFSFESVNTHQVLISIVVDARILGCVANSLQERRFASISTSDYKDTEASIFLSELIGITVAHCRDKERLRGKAPARLLVLYGEVMVIQKHERY